MVLYKHNNKPLKDTPTSTTTFTPAYGCIQLCEVHLSKYKGTFVVCQATFKYIIMYFIVF